MPFNAVTGSFFISGGLVLIVARPSIILFGSLSTTLHKPNPNHLGCF
jgi:hypothetical protein